MRYSRSHNLTNRHATNKVLVDKALASLREILSERAVAAAVWTAMKAKTKIGMGIKPKKTTKKKMVKKRIFPTAKRGGALPFLPILGALGSWNGQRGESGK